MYYYCAFVFSYFPKSIKSYAQYENSSYLIDRLMNSLKKVNRIFYQMKLNIIPLTLTFYYLCHLCVTYYKPITMFFCDFITQFLKKVYNPLGKLKVLFVNRILFKKLEVGSSQESHWEGI